MSAKAKPGTKKSVRRPPPAAGKKPTRWRSVRMGCGAAVRFDGRVGTLLGNCAIPDCRICPPERYGPNRPAVWKRVARYLRSRVARSTRGLAFRLRIGRRRETIWVGGTESGNTPAQLLRVARMLEGWPEGKPRGKR